ncbi:MAG: IS630 family transposase, partial [Planctomycetes bacterium]|nr:IS630 family transposase [Planctomycetota bacterium]
MHISAEPIYLFCAVCPKTGATEALVSPFSNKEAMKQHLKQISEATEEGYHAVILIDGAGWHTNDIADEFTNLSMSKLPPYSPE